MSARAILFVAMTIGFALLPARLVARGDLGLDHDACVLKVGPELIYFAGYQPVSSHRKFCEDAPATGETIFVFDYAEPELREMKVAFRILRDAGETEDAAALDAATAAFLPPQVYPKGTFSFEHVFAESGDYVGLLTVDGPAGEHWTARFPFSVGKSHYELTPYLLIGAAGLLAAALFVTSRRGAAATKRGARGRR
ncbi:hypothetical protein [Methylosinus sp. Sm6]|uniref:hypothetical protein n=1 Tax=Methylosinus sp. Sm6 TaxID=2866948 RepID=UPI001C98F4E8|nr:hypothetical protein [Methylosinus sp. Sm6]MBY6243178.1 hypothetical protein [Methylosinus sp. Sm6]